MGLLPLLVDNLFYSLYHVGITMEDDNSPPESDSGIAGSVAGSSFTSSLDTSDLHLDKSSFYHNPNSAEVAPRKKARSSFYGGDTLLPPTPEHRSSSGNKFTSAFSKVNEINKRSSSQVRA